MAIDLVAYNKRQKEKLKSNQENAIKEVKSYYGVKPPVSNEDFIKMYKPPTSVSKPYTAKFNPNVISAKYFPSAANPQEQVAKAQAQIHNINNRNQAIQKEIDKPVNLFKKYTELNNEYKKELDPLKKKILQSNKNNLFQRTLSNSPQMSKLKPEDIEYIKSNPQDYIKALEKEESEIQFAKNLKNKFKLSELRTKETEKQNAYNDLVGGAINLDRFKKSDEQLLKESLSTKTAQNDLGKSFTYGLLNVLQGPLSVAEGVQKFVGGVAGKTLGIDKLSETALNLDNAGKLKKLYTEELQPSEAQQNVGNFIEAGSSLIPSIAANAVVPGSGLALIGTSAAGSSAGEGYKKSGDINSSLFYGALSGSVEVATEKLFAGIPMLQKSGVVSDVINKVTGLLNKNPILKKAIVSGADIVGEGLEEAISTFVDPYLQRATNVDPKASNATGTELMQSAVMGGLLSLAMKGGYKVGDIISDSKKPKVTKPFENAVLPQQTTDVSKIPFKGIETIKSTAINGSAYVPQATIIKSPYQGEIPEMSQSVERIVPEIAKSNVDIAKSKINLVPVLPTDTSSLAANNAITPERKAPNLSDTNISRGNDGINTYDMQSSTNNATSKIELLNAQKALDNFLKNNLISDTEIQLGKGWAVGNLNINDIRSEKRKSKFINIEKVLEFGELYGIVEDYKQEISKNQSFNNFSENKIDMSDIANTEPPPQKTPYTNFEAEPLSQKIEPLTVEQVKNAHKDVKTAQKALDKYIRDNGVLSEYEMTLSQALSNGTDSFLDLKYKQSNDPTINFKKIVTHSELSDAVKEQRKIIKQYQKELKEQRFYKALAVISNSDNWKDKKFGIQYSRETMLRNNLDIAKADSEKLNREYFDPVQTGQAKETRFKNNYRQRVKNLNLNEHESAMVQLKAENDFYKANPDYPVSKSFGEITGQKLTELEPFMSKIDMVKVEKGIKEFRSIYDEIFPMINDTLIKNGYEPVEMRQGYFPHFSENKLEGPFGKALEKLGIKVLGEELPTDIAGLTHTFRPGKTYNKFMNQRKGDKTVFDAIEGFDRYIESAASSIYRTEVIQNLRALENAIRYKYSDDGQKEKFKEIMSNKDTSDIDKQDALDKLYEESHDNHMSQYVVELKTYTDLLANKKHEADRPIAKFFSRKIYPVFQSVFSKIGANMVGANLGSALTNVIPLTQARAVVSQSSMIKAAYDTVKSYTSDDGFADLSTFLTNRKGSDRLIESKISKAIAAPMYHVDNFTANVITRGKYLDNIKSGMDEVSARANADKFAAGLMGDRSKGAMPTVFEMKNILAKPFTMFQLEVNNQLSYVFKDLPREFAEKGKISFATGLFKMFIGAFLYNELYEMLVGRRPALDPIGMTKNFIEKSTEKGIGKGLETIALDVADQTPFIGGLLGGGRIPVSSAIPFAGALEGNKAFNLSDPETSGKKKGEIILDELSKPLFYIATPVGGGAVKKAFEGIAHQAQGGTYTYNNEGQKQLQYPANDNPLEWFRAATFGKTATGAGQKWVNEGFGKLSVKQTNVYDTLRKQNFSNDESYKIIEQVTSLKDLPADKKRDAIMGMPLTPEQKAMIDDNLVSELTQKRDYTDPVSYQASAKLSGKYYDAYNDLLNNGADKSASFDTLYRISKSEKAEQKQQAILKSNLTLSEKQKLNDILFSDTKKRYDYSDEENYLVSTLTDSEKKKYNNFKLFNPNMTAKEFIKIQKEEKAKKEKYKNLK